MADIEFRGERYKVIGKGGDWGEVGRRRGRRGMINNTVHVTTQAYNIHEGEYGDISAEWFMKGNMGTSQQNGS